MDTLIKLYASVEAHLRAKTAHAFLLTGNVADDFPAQDGRGFVALERSLAERFPHRLMLKLDLVRGLTVRTASDADKAKEALEAKKPDRKKKDDDPIEAARAAIDQPEEDDVLAENVGAAFHVLRRLVRQDEQKLLVWVPRLEAVTPANQGTDAGLRAAVDSLLSLVRDAEASENGHLFIFAAKTAASLDAALIEPDSRIVQMRIPRPDQEERLAAIRRLTLDDEETERLAERERRIRDLRPALFNRARELFHSHVSAITAAQERADEAESRVAAEIERENRERRDQIGRLEARLEQARRAAAEADREATRLYGEWRRKRVTRKEAERAVMPVERRTWSELEVGDRIFQRYKDEVSWYVVLEKREQRYVLSFPIKETEAGAEPRPMRSKRGDICLWSWDAEQDDGVSMPSGRIHARDAKGASTLDPCIVRLGGEPFVAVRARLEEVKAEDAKAADKIRARIGREVAAARSAAEGAWKRFRGELRSDPGVASLREEAKKAAYERDLALQGRFPRPEMPLAELSRITSGLSHRDLRDIFALARAEGGKLDYPRVSQLKLKRLNDAYGHLIEVVEPSYGLEGIGGLDYVKTEMRRIISAIRRGKVRAVPMGVMLMGPPGTGKTALAEALARETGFSFVKLKNVRSMWVGESERRIEEILGALKDLAPCIVLRDEVDQEDTGRDAFQGDSGVSARIRQRWMEFLSDPKIRGRVLVISCTNRPDLIDAAMKRSGRSDVRIPILMPDTDTLERVFQVMMGPRYGIPNSIASFRKFAEMTLGLSGADVERICLESYNFAEADGRDDVRESDIEAAVEDFIPSADQYEILRMTVLAVRQASSKRLMPDVLLPKLERELEEMIAARSGAKAAPEGSN